MWLWSIQILIAIPTQTQCDFDPFNPNCNSNPNPHFMHILLQQNPSFRNRFSVSHVGFFWDCPHPSTTNASALMPISASFRKLQNFYTTICVICKYAYTLMFSKFCKICNCLLGCECMSACIFSLSHLNLVWSGIFLDNAQMIHFYQKCQQNQFLHESSIISHLHPFPIPNVVWLCKFSTLLWVFFKCSEDMFFEHPTDLVVFAHVGMMWKRISMHNLKKQSVDLSCLLWGRKDKPYDKEQTGSKYTDKVYRKQETGQKQSVSLQIKQKRITFTLKLETKYSFLHFKN